MSPKTFLAAGAAGLERATRREGGGWAVEKLLTGQEICCLAVDPRRGEVTYAGTQHNGLFRSRDGGATWQPSGLAGMTVKSVAASPAQDGLVVAGTKPALLFLSTDYGETWQELEGFRRVPGRWWWFSPAEAPGTAYVQAIALSPVEPALMLAGIELGAVLLSEDGGRSWSGHRKGALRDCHSLQFHVSDGDWVYEAGGTGGGVSVSRDGGRTWRKRQEGLDRHYGWTCAADPATPEVWYASLAPSASRAHSNGRSEAMIYRAEGGANWVPLTGGLPQPLQEMPYALLTDPAQAGHLYAGLAGGQLWHSSSYGDEWRPLSLRFSRIDRSLVML